MAKYIFTPCRCPACGGPSHGFVDEIGIEPMDCWDCFMREFIGKGGDGKK